MSKRYTVLGLSVVLALALAVPAFGGPTNPVASISASAKKIALKALKKANAAQKTANTALETANTANGTANSALTEAKKGVANAATAQTEAKKGVANAATAQTTANEAKTAAAAAEANANNRLKGVYRKFGTGSASNTETSKSDSVLCTSGDEATGGGYGIGGAGANSVTVTNSSPTFYGDGWFVTGQTISGTPTWSIQVQAVCAEK
jgi:cell wall-associated NlpC family hydrolase